MSHLKAREWYEGFYDKLTVQFAREDLGSFFKFNDELKKKLSKKEFEAQGTMFWLDKMADMMVFWPCGERWEKRGTEIDRMMREDENKDRQLENARLRQEPICKHCGKIGLRITDKHLMYRNGYSEEVPEEVLFMLDCPACEKRSAYWESGELFEKRPTFCPKCQGEMKERDNHKSKIITTTYICPKCKYSYKDTLDLRSKPEELDPDFEKHKALFCFDNKTGVECLQRRNNWKALQEMFDKEKEKEQNEALYGLVGKIKRLKIAELIELMQKELKKSEFIEVQFEKPEIGKDVIISFSCLEGDSKRSAYDSEKTLKRAVKKTLHPTNWRLMTEGVSYRLGYLTGRVRAYENEEDLVTLIEKDQPELKRREKPKPIINPYEVLDKDGNPVTL